MENTRISSEPALEIWTPNKTVRPHQGRIYGEAAPAPPPQPTLRFEDAIFAVLLCFFQNKTASLLGTTYRPQTRSLHRAPFFAHFKIRHWAPCLIFKRKYQCIFNS